MAAPEARNNPTETEGAGFTPAAQPQVEPEKQAHPRRGRAGVAQQNALGDGCRLCYLHGYFLSGFWWHCSALTSSRKTLL